MLQLGFNIEYVWVIIFFPFFFGESSGAKFEGAD